MYYQVLHNKNIYLGDGADLEIRSGGNDGVINQANADLKIQSNINAAIIIPDKDIIPGAKTLSPAYLIFENYEKILTWNRSLRFALAVCTLKKSFKNEI